jgi:hypothetical protein
MATKSAAKKSAPAKQSAPKSQASKQDSPLMEVRAEAVTFPTDESNEALEQERAELHKPGRVSKSDTEFIDNEPGYNRDQLAHMREYWGIKESDSAAAAEEGQLVEEVS